MQKAHKFMYNQSFTTTLIFNPTAVNQPLNGTNLYPQDQHDIPKIYNFILSVEWTDLPYWDLPKLLFNQIYIPGCNFSDVSKCCLFVIDNIYYIIMWWSDSRRVLDWWPDILDSLVQHVTTLHRLLLRMQTRTHRLVSNHIFTATAWYQLQTADIPLPLSSRSVPSLSYQLLTARAHNWAPAVLWLTDC
jgi:hypothetical protein